MFPDSYDEAELLKILESERKKLKSLVDKIPDKKPEENTDNLFICRKLSDDPLFSCTISLDYSIYYPEEDHVRVFFMEKWKCLNIFRKKGFDRLFFPLVSTPIFISYPDQEESVTSICTFCNDLYLLVLYASRNLYRHYFYDGYAYHDLITMKQHSLMLIQSHTSWMIFVFGFNSITFVDSKFEISRSFNVGDYPITDIYVSNSPNLMLIKNTNEVLLFSLPENSIIVSLNVDPVLGCIISEKCILIVLRNSVRIYRERGVLDKEMEIDVHVACCNDRIFGIVKSDKHTIVIMNYDLKQYFSIELIGEEINNICMSSYDRKMYLIVTRHNGSIEVYSITYH